MEIRNEVINDINNLEYDKLRTWKPFMEKYDCQNVCEVGVRKGENFYKMVEHKPQIAVAVDIWKEDGVVAHNDICCTQEDLDKQYSDFVEITSDKPYVKIHRDYSTEVAKLYPDNYFDFVYIDADHTYEGTMADLKAWYPKVRKGKFFFGDDFSIHTSKSGVVFGVMNAVTKFAHVNNLSFFVFPRSKWGMIK